MQVFHIGKAAGYMYKETNVWGDYLHTWYSTVQWLHSQHGVLSASTKERVVSTLGATRGLS